MLVTNECTQVHSKRKLQIIHNYVVIIYNIMIVNDETQHISYDVSLIRINSLVIVQMIL